MAVTVITFSLKPAMSYTSSDPNARGAGAGPAESSRQNLPVGTGGAEGALLFGTGGLDMTGGDGQVSAQCH